jgi:glycogen debranching enzyme
MRLDRTADLADPYVTAGDRAYLVGTQDGQFPDRGWHVEGEMGGLWAHPIKLLDGFWLAVDRAWLPAASQFTVGPYWGAHRWNLLDDLTVLRRQYVPDGRAGIVVRYSFLSPTPRTLALRFLARTDLQGVWASDREGVSSGRDAGEYDPALRAWIARDTANDWSVIVGGRGWTPTNTDAGHDLWGPQETRGEGISLAMDVDLALEAGIEREFVVIIAGSHQSDAEARRAFLALRDSDSLEPAKETRYMEMVGRSALSTPDRSIEGAWDWLKCNNDWLIRDVAGVGRGLGAGIDDYPWWFGCDSAFSVLGCLALGQQRAAIETLDLIRNLSERANEGTGRVLHEANTWGYVTHPGCTQETPHFTTSIWETFRWTGDWEFLRRSYDFCKRGVLQWALAGEIESDGDLMPYGYGIIEVEGLNLQCVDTATHMVAALDALRQMALLLGDDETAARCVELHARADEQLEERFWLEEEGLYADMLAAPDDIAPRVEHLLVMSEHPVSLTRDKPEVAAQLQQLLTEARTDPSQTRKRAWLLKNWTVISPVIEGLAPAHRAARVLDRAEGPEFSGPWGMYLSGIDRTHQMSVNTGALALAEARYGRPDEALARLRLLTDTLHLHMPGAISEMSPDYGCFVQAWSAYAVAWPVVRGFFGIQPDAHRKSITISPCFPSSWRKARLENVSIGTALFDFHWDGSRTHVACSDHGWSVVEERPDRSTRAVDA